MKMWRLENYAELNSFHLRIKYLLTAKTKTHPIAIPNTKPTGENPFNSLESDVGESVPSRPTDLEF